MRENRENPMESVEFLMMPGNSGPNSESDCPRFFVLFQKHWKSGTGLAAHDQPAMKRDGSWTVRTFSNAMEWAGLGSIDPATIQSWLDGERWPQKERKNAILKVFFRLPKVTQNDQETGRLRDEMDVAWLEGQAARTRSQSFARNEEREVIAGWIASGTPVHTPGLALLMLDEPQQGNEPDAPWYVGARLRLQTAKHERRDGSYVFIALRTAFLSIGVSGYRVVNGSLIGQEKRAENPNFQGENDGAEVVGPREEGFCLGGDPLAGDYIAQIKPADDGKSEESVTVALHAFRDSFAISLSPKPSDSEQSDVARTEKNAVLNALIAKGRVKDSQGRMLLARDTWKRKKPE